MTVEVRRFATTAELAQAAAAFFSRASTVAVEARGRFCAVLPGGRTPAVLYAALREPPWREAVPWARVNLFWSDERCVPPGHPDSNHALARRELLDHVPVPVQNIHRAPAEAGTPEDAAAAWENALRVFFAKPAGEESFPDFDLAILGLGADGHTASLFPGDAALEEKKRWVMPVPAQGTPHVARVTLTLPVFNHARSVLFLAAGPDKRTVFDASVTGRVPAGATYPAAQIRPRAWPIWFYSEAPP